MTNRLPQPATDYVRFINERDRLAFRALFADDAVIDDNGRRFQGRPEIDAWSDREIFEPLVTLEVLDVADRDGTIVVTTRVDGNFPRTGLPDPVILDHHVTTEGGKIVGLTCRLSSAQPKK